MAARSQPMGSVPEKSGVSPDVKTEESFPSPAPQTLTEEGVKSSKSQKPSEEEVDLDEKDLQSLEEESKKIPYSRFKEKNDENKVLKEQIQELSRRHQEDLRRVQEDAEIRAQARLKAQMESGEQDSLDPYEKLKKPILGEISSLKHELQTLRIETENQKLQSRMERLKEKYPDADQKAVLGWKKALPQADLEELMEESHREFNERANRKLKELIEHKKTKAKAAIPTRDSGIRLKETEKPKTLQEAHGIARRILGF